MIGLLAALDAPTVVEAFGLGAVYSLMAVGIGLVFGVLRLVNFAYGQLVMVGAYTLAFTASWPVAASIVACYAVVVALSLAMDRAVFRPLRGESPAVMLVTTFAIAFVLQAVALLIDIRDDTIGEIASSIASFNQAITVAGVDVRKITIAAMVIAVVVLALLAVLLTRTTIGLHMRAAASDFGTARLLGVQADRVIGFAVLLSGLVAATVAVILTVQNPFVGPVFAFLVGLPLMRLSGLAAGIATLAVLEITHNLLREWTKIGPGATTLSLVPETTGPLQATIGALVVVAVAFAYQRSRLGRMLRATREDAAAARGVGVNVHAQRLWAFTLSGALAAFSGALLVHELGSITTEQVYLELTFVTLAMLVVGGVSSLWGAVLGGLVVSGGNSFLTEAEQGVDVGLTLDLPSGTRLILLGSLMALVLILRPAGLTGGRELRLSPPNIGSATRRRLSPRGD